MQEFAYNRLQEHRTTVVGVNKRNRGILTCALAGALALVTAQVHAAQDPVDFAGCVAMLGAEAKGNGITADTVARTVQSVEFRPQVVTLDRGQPEFVTRFGDYFSRSVTDHRVERGKRLLEEHGPLLDDIYREFGVPPRYLVALWGMETNYGSYFGSMPVLDSLATLACDGRRAELFTRQFIAALQIVDDGAMQAEVMAGSWAGAMGHLQFLPSVYLEYAVDFDGSGRADLWNSLPDAMASAANYLNAIGWQTGIRWGREVALPEGFPHELAGRDRRRPLAEWRELGVMDAWGRDLPVADLDAALLLPAGHEGPAFLVYPNFDIIMQWNRSTYYALAVGRLADRLVGDGALRRPPPAYDGPLERERIVALQERLNEKGFDAGPADGIPGPMTRAAIREFQLANGMIADGYPSKEVLDRLELRLAELD